MKMIVASKTETKGKNGRKSNDEIKEELLKSMTDSEIIRFYDEENCEKRAVFIKKGVLNLIYIYRTSLEQVKLVKALEKHPQLEVVINFK